MFTFHFGPLSRQARMVLHFIAGCVGMCVLIGPTLFALASSPPISTATAWTPLTVLAVKPFQALTESSGMPVPPLHAGPGAVEGTVVGRSELQARLTSAMFACTQAGWTGDVTISAAVDARGTISDVRTAGNVSSEMKTCLGTEVLIGDPLAVRGPGTLRASYFGGARR